MACNLPLQRLGRLVREGRMLEALQLGLDLYEGKAKAVVGKLDICLSVLENLRVEGKFERISTLSLYLLSVPSLCLCVYVYVGLHGPPKKRKELVSEQVVDILQAYVDVGVMMHKGVANEKELREHYMVYQYFYGVCHGCDALPICDPISACIVSATVTLPDCYPVHYISIAFIAMYSAYVVVQVSIRSVFFGGGVARTHGWLLGALQYKLSQRHCVELGKFTSDRSIKLQMFINTPSYCASHFVHTVP